MAVIVELVVERSLRSPVEHHALVCLAVCLVVCIRRSHGHTDLGTDSRFLVAEAESSTLGDGTVEDVIRICKILFRTLLLIDQRADILSERFLDVSAVVGDLL